MQAASCDLLFLLRCVVVVVDDDDVVVVIVCKLACCCCGMEWVTTSQHVVLRSNDPASAQAN